MFRRSRFNARPNVGTVGRAAAATPQETPPATQDAGETPKDVSESSTATPVADNTSVMTPSEKPAGDGNDQNVEGTSSSAAVQRRKRFSIKPKVAPGRPSAAARMTKSPVKAVSETPVDVPDKSSQTGTTAAPQRLQSPRRRRPSEESKQQLKTQPKPSLISSDGSEPPAAPTAVDSVVCSPADSASGSQVKEVPSRPPEKVIFSIPDREAIALSEKAKTLMSSKSGPSLSPPAFSLSRLLNDPSDLQRLAKARKLRDLLKQEMHKEKKQRKTNKRVKEYNLDPAKMTMRDLIRYLPLSNPMTSSLEDSGLENETVVPTSPVRDESPERAQEPAVVPKIASPREEEEEEEGEEGEEGAEGAEEDEDDGVMVPQVKVAEDGSLIIDEESLTVEVQRAKGPNLAQERDPIFERGSTTTYSSFRKGTYSKPWSSEETDMFFLAISMVGTDFSMICQLFPHRARSEIKNKFKKEERENSWRIDKAFRERRKLDIEYFSKLLEKILEVQKNRKKLKALAGKKSPKKSTRKPKGKKASRKLSVVEEEDEEEQSEIPDLEEEEEEGEKENEDLCNEGGTAVAQPKKKRKRKSKQDASTEEPNDKKNKTGEKTTEQDEANTPGDTEAALPEDRPASDMSDKTKTDGEVKDATIKPAKLSRGRAPKPLLPLGRKWGKKAAAAGAKTDDTTPNKGDESGIDGASEEQVNKDAESPLKQADNRQSADDDEEDAPVQPPRPTRYGRVPKATKLLNYPAKEETAPTSPTGSPASGAKPRCPAKRGRSSKLQSAQESKKPKLVTLKATQSEYGDEEDDEQPEEEEEPEEEQDCSGLDGSAPVFVPASLRSPNPVISEVEETMEELDILAHMPDVLGISQDALCPDASCERAHNETGTAEPCEHQLDLLVDVIDFLSSDHTEVSVSADESYNEAAQTLLTIGNLAHLTQSAQNQVDVQDDVTGTTSVSVNETSQPLEKEIASKPAVQEEIDSIPLQCASSDRGVTETVPTVEPRSSTTDNDDVSVIERSDSDVDPTPQLQSPESSKASSPQTRRGRVSRVKPKPNLGQASRTAQVKSQPETSNVRTSEESCSVPQTADTPSATEETSETADCSQRLSKDDVACIEVKHTEETSGNQERSVGPVEPSREPANTGSRFTSQSTEEAPIAESISSNLLTSDAAVTESQIGLESNIVSTPVPESSNHPAPCVAPVEELPVGKMEENQVPPTQQTRKSRFQKVKPKVNLAQASRAVRSKPQTTKDAVENDPTPDPTLNEKPAVEAKAESTCSAFPEKPSQSHDPASDLIPSLDLGVLAPTEDLSTTEQKNPDVGVVVQVESDSAASHQSSSESQNLTEAQFEPSKEQTIRDTTSTSESTDEKLTSHVGHTQGITESEVGRGSDSVPVQEVEESPVRQEEEVKPAFRTTRGQLQKVKPNLPQTSRGARSKPQTTKDAVEKDPTPDPKLNEKPAVEAKAESTCSASPEKPSQSHDPASDLIPSLDLGMTLTPTEELSSMEQKNPDVGVVVQVESDSAASHQSASESQNLSETQFEPSKEQTSRDTTPTSESTDEKLTSHVGHTQGITESEVGRGSDSVPVQEVEESPVRQEEEVKPAFRTTRGQLQKVKPNLPQTSRAARSKPQTTKDPIVPTQPAETPSAQTTTPEPTEDTLAKLEVQPTCSTNPETLSQTASVSLELHSTHKTMEELSSSEEQKAEVGRGLDSNSAGSQQNVPRRRFPKVKPKPNLASSPRTARAKLQPDDGGKAPESQPVDNNGAPTEQEPVESGKSLDGRNNEGTSSDGVVVATSRVAESRSASTDSVVENKSGEKLTVESTREETSTNESQEAVQLRPETSQTAAQSTVDKKSEATEPPSRQGPQARRGRLIKPRLGRSTIRPPQPQQVQNTKRAERVSEHPAGIQQPVEGAIEQVPDSCTRFQDASTSRTETQHSPDLTVFPDLSVLSQPSDQDEPFFILSLTEIPVCPSGEVEEPLPYLPLTDASTQRWSVPGDVPVSMETPHESTTVHPAKLPETGENTDETGIPSTNQRPMGTRRGAKLEPDTTKGGPASESVAAKEAEAAQRSEPAGPSVLPDAVDDAVNEPQGGSGDHVGGGEGPENSGSKAQTSRARGGVRRWNSDSLSLSPETALAGDSGRGRGAPRGRKVRTRGGKRPTPTRSTTTPPTLSTSFITSPTPTELQDVTRTSEGGPSPDASSCPAEVSVAMETSSIEEEPTNVSQYFLSDIFTDVDET